MSVPAPSKAERGFLFVSACLSSKSVKHAFQFGCPFATRSWKHKCRDHWIERLPPGKSLAVLLGFCNQFSFYHPPRLQWNNCAVNDEPILLSSKISAGICNQLPKPAKLLGEFTLTCGSPSVLT